MILTITAKEWDRKDKALLHDDEMGLKYSELHGRMDAHGDYHYWYEELADTDSANSLRTKIHRDYPLPYSQTHYFRRFAELFFARGTEDSIEPTLAHEFIGDEIDGKYIEGLLIKAKDYGFFTPRAMIIFHGSALTPWPPLEKGSHYRPDPVTGGYREIYEGSKANKDRAEVIRRWLKARAKELASTPHAVSSATVTQSTSSEQNPSPANNSAFSIQGQSPQATFSPFVPNGAFTVKDADALANVIRLINDAGSFLGKFPSARLYGFYSHLRCKEVLRGTDEELRDYFFMRYLKKTSKSHPTSDTTAGKTVAKDTEKAFKRWEKEQNQG